MAFIQATFSLPGLAGLALTIGMAVDANVLVFERMREEKERGASLAQQIRNGFNRAWITIFDSHVTNFLAAVVLYMVGTEEVKGFALTMMIGMAWNLFTAVFMSRVIFEYCYSKGWLKKMTMLKMMDKTNIDFIGPALLLHGRLADPDRPGADRHVRPRAERCSTSTSPAGRWSRSGSTRTTRRSRRCPTPSRAASSSARRPSVLPDVTVESLRVSSDKSLTRFNIRTTDQNPEHVKKAILEAFGSSLARVEMTVSEGKPIAGAAAGGRRRPPTPTATRFAGGREYELDFNTTAFNSTISRRRRSSRPSSSRS